MDLNVFSCLAGSQYTWKGCVYKLEIMTSQLSGCIRLTKNIQLLCTVKLILYSRESV